MKLQKLYTNPEAFTYYSPRFRKSRTIPKGRTSDGATGARDISGPYHGTSKGWWVHDELKATELWDDGSRCSNAKASWVLSDILKTEGRWFRAHTWFWTTLIFGEIKRLRKSGRPTEPPHPNTTASDTI